MEMPGWLVLMLPVSVVLAGALVLWWFVRRGTAKIHRAASGGDVVSLSALLAAEPDLVRAKDLTGLLPLQYAACWGRVEAAKILLDHGADVDGGSGMSPLQYAIHEDHQEMVELLLERGADINAECERDGSTPLLTAVIRKHSEMVRFLIEHGAQLDAKTKSAWNACHFAAGTGDIPSMQLLVENGADWRAENANHQTPRQVALANGHHEMVRLLSGWEEG